jgi:hypothetical protein
VIFLLMIGSLASLESLYQGSCYDSVVQLAPAYLADSTSSRSDSIRVFELWAFAQVATGRNEVAALTFQRLLTLQPDLQLDAETVSPKIRSVFDQVKQEMRSSTKPVPPLQHDTVLLRPHVPLSVLIPGLYQVQQRRKTKGYALLFSGAISLAGLVASEVAYERAHNQYLNTTQPSMIPARYNTANNWFRTRTVFVGTTTLIWLCGLIDGLLDP